MLLSRRSLRLIVLMLGPFILAGGIAVHGQYQRPFQRFQTQPGYRPNTERLQRNPAYYQPNTASPKLSPINNQAATNLLATGGAAKAPAKSYSLYPRMMAEFEPQRAIVLSVSDLQPHHQHVFKQIVDKSAGHANILILYNDNQQLKDTVELLSKSPADHVSFYQLKLDTVWLRDFGPRISEVKDGTRTIDFFYYGVRPYDDAFPERWSLETDSRLDKVPWTLQGGNLICNGQGLGIATTKIFDDNPVSIGARSSVPTVNEQGKHFVLQELKKEINLQEIVILEPLHNESTKHVDMFAAFVASDHVVVAELGPGTHRSNQQILDYNARKLARIRIDGKPLKVTRIRIPQPQGTSWSTYTNAIFTDRLILLPTMKTDPPSIVANAKKIYQRLLPDHHIATVDITSMKNLQGSLHCLSINLPAAAPLPEGVIDFSTAKQIADRTPARKKPKTSKPKLINRGYTIDEQLRRIFKSSNQDYLVDAYAVGLQGDVVTLLRYDDKTTLRVKTKAVCKTDQYWINRNATKIRQHGANVYRTITSRAGR